MQPREHEHPLTAVALILAALLPLLAVGCDYARMTNDDGYDTYETLLPLMPPDSVSVDPGATALRLVDPRALQNPLAATPPVLARGLFAYDNFCIQCHGPRGDGHATVGQSFAPLPTDLTGQQVKDTGDGVLFQRIAFGHKRHPALIDTMTTGDVWAVIVFIRQAEWAGRPGYKGEPYSFPKESSQAQ